MKLNLSSLLLLALFLSPQVFAKNKTATPADNPLIAYWDFDEVVDNKIMDRSGNGHDGNVTGAVLEEGKLGKSMLFTGANKTFVVVDSSEKFSFPNKQFTFMAWIKPKTLIPLAGVVLNIASSYQVLQVNKNGLSYSDPIMPYPCDFGEWGKLEQDKWQHVAAVRNGDKVILYIDGREVGARLLPGELKTLTSKIYIGTKS